MSNPITGMTPLSVTLDLMDTGAFMMIDHTEHSRSWKSLPTETRTALENIQTQIEELSNTALNLLKQYA